VNDLKSGFGTYASTENGFFTGQVAMMIDGEWMSGPNFIPKFAPELYYGVAPLPVPTDRSDAYGSAVVGGTVVVVPAMTKDRPATAKLLAWMESPEVIADVMYRNANLPSSKQAALDPRFKQIKRFPLFIDIMAHPRSTGQFSSPIHEELADALAKAQERMWQEGADPVQLLDDIQREFEPKLAEAWKKVK
jgi:ABC-type glycerol-3-phosphate transport system substrate-binding protein